MISKKVLAVVAGSLTALGGTGVGLALAQGHSGAAMKHESGAAMHHSGSAMHESSTAGATSTG